MSKDAFSWKIVIVLLLWVYNEGAAQCTIGYNNLACSHQDINCTYGAGWEKEKDGVVFFQYFDQQTQVATKGSGVLVTTTDLNGTYYLLTASHLVNTQTEANSMCIFFNYENIGCSGTYSTTPPFLSGATVIASSSNLDFTLLRLNDPLPSNVQVYHNGWDISGNSSTNSTCIHHPNGHPKKISIDADATGIGNFDQVNPYAINYDNNTHWKVNFDLGNVESGSSGAPLFNDDFNVIGVYSGTSIGLCLSPKYYQQLKHTWEDYPQPGNQLKHWLDPNNSGMLKMDGTGPGLCAYHFEPNNNRNTAESVFPVLTNPFNGFLKSYLHSSFDQDYFALNLGSEGHLTLTLTDLPEDYNLKLYSLNGLLLSQSSNSGLTDDIVTYDHGAGISTTVFLQIEPAVGVIGGCQPYKVEVNFDPCSDTNEPNQPISSAHQVTPAFAMSSTTKTFHSFITGISDDDWYEVPLSNNGVLEINLSGLPENYDIELYGASGLSNFIDASNNSGQSGETITYTYTGGSPTSMYIKVYPATPLFNRCVGYDLRFSWHPSTSGCIPILASVSATGETASGAMDGTATVSITAGEPPYTILWNNGSSTAHINGLSSGTYTVTVTGSDGCTIQKSVIVSGCAGTALNNFPCCAEPITIPSTCVPVQTAFTTLYDSTHIPIPACDSPGTMDMWYQFIVPPSGIISFNSWDDDLTPYTLDDIGAQLYSGASCGNLSEIPGTCIKNSLNLPGGDYMPIAENIDLSGYIGQTVYLRLWEFGQNKHFGTFQFCITESSNTCNYSLLEIVSSKNETSSVKLGDDNLTVGENQLIQWKVVAHQNIPNAVVGLYKDNAELHTQIISVSQGDTICVCPPPSITIGQGADTGKVSYYSLHVLNGYSDVTLLSASSPLVCREPVRIYTPQIRVQSLSQFVHEAGDTLQFHVEKNIQEPVELWVHNTATQDSFLVTLSLDFDSATYNNAFGLCSQSWVIPNAIPDGSYQLVARGTIRRDVVGRGANFIIGGCISPFIAFPQETLFATEFLCFNGLIGPTLDSIQVVNEFMPLGEAASLTFEALYYINPTAALGLPSDTFPVPFGNLQQINSNNLAFYKAARALSYLTYDDFESGLPRNWFYFPEGRLVSRGLALRLLLEVFNIALTNTSISNYYNDVPATHPYASWINQAAQRGIAQLPQGSQFRPNDPITYQEFYVFLFRIMANYNTVGYIPYPAPQREDYYVPGNYTPSTIPYHLDVTDGVFSYPGEAVFSIPGKGLSIDFGFTYSSAETDLPIEFYRDPVNPTGYDFQSLGNGWSHTYEAYILRTRDSLSGNVKHIFMWPSNQILVYDSVDGAFDTPSIFDDVSFSSNLIEVETKSFVTYQFQKVPGNQYYILKSITDQYGNYLDLQYLPHPISGLPRLDKITESNNPSRYIKLKYSTSNPSKLESLEENVLSRRVTFSVNGNTLRGFTDVSGQTYTYSYISGVGQWSYLLTEISLPKNNSARALYWDSKLLFVKIGNNYSAAYNWKPKYSLNNPAEFTTCRFTSAAGLISEVVKDRYGRVKNYNSPTSNLYVANYDNGSNLMLPTEWSNNGITYESDYNNKGNQTLSRRSSGSLSIESHFQYDVSTGNLLKKYTDPNGHEYNYSYNTSHYGLEQVTLPNNAQYKIVSRTSSGQILQMQSPLNINVEYAYNSDGYLESISNTNLPNTTITIQPDAIGRTTQIVDANNKTTSFSYNPLGQLLSNTNQMGWTSHLTYNSNHFLSTIENYRNEVTTLSYSQEEDYYKQYKFGSTQVSLTHNNDGSPATISKGGNVNPFSYSATTNLVTASPGNTYSYDSRHRVIKITNSIHQTELRFQYDALDRLIEVTSLTGTKTYKTGYEYDDNGNVIRLYYDGLGSSRYVDYEYDNLNRCIEVWDWKSASAALVAYTYDDDSKLILEEYRNGTKTFYKYDSGGRLLQIQTKNSSGQTICSNSFTLDNAGLHTSETFSTPGSSAAYPQFSHQANSYQQSPYNQTLGVTVNGVYNSIQYDPAGNVSVLGDLKFAWDFNDKLQQVWKNNTLQAQYKYDGMGSRRFKKLYSAPDYPTVDEVYYNLDVHGMGHVISEEIKHYDGTWDTIYFIHSPNGLISRNFGSATEFFHYDYRGSVLATTNQDETITHSYQYMHDGLIGHAQGQNYDLKWPNFYTYVGKWGVQKDVTELYYMRARYMYYQLGRFLEQDPIWSNNLYIYANNDPMNFVDVNGAKSSLPNKVKRLIKGWRKNLELLDQCYSRFKPQASCYKNQYNDPVKTLEDFLDQYKSTSERSYTYSDIALGQQPIFNKLPNRLSNVDYTFIDLANGDKQLDLLHFMVVGQAGYLLGYINESKQFLLPNLKEDKPASAFYPQDLYSNKLGIRFFNLYGDRLERNPNKIAEYMYEFLSNPDNL